jgi:NAD(P)-dependent dehydrogenase (short-subunit alcohol dehydrogenase family)
VVADLASPDAAKTLVEAAVAFSGGVDIVVHNAAFTGASGLPGYAVPFSEQSVEAWEAAMRVNTTVAFSLVQQALPFLEKSGKGAVLMIGSIYGVVAPNMNLYTGTKMGNPAAYAASKAGLLQLVRYLSTVLAPKVRVNALSPGGIARGQPEAFQERYRTLTPLARMGEEVDAKGAVALLCSDAGAYITGQNLMVDGGWTAW